MDNLAKSITLSIPDDFPRVRQFLVDPGIGRLEWCGAQVKAEQPQYMNMRILGKFALVFMLAGDGMYEDVRTGVRRIRGGDCIVVFPDLAHRYGPAPDERWEEVFVVFGGPVFDVWYERGRLDPARPVIHLDDPAAWLARFTTLMQDATSQDPATGLAVLVRFQALLADLSALAGDPATAAPPDWLCRACEHLAEGLGEAPDYAALARDLGMSYESFRKRFAAHMGLPPDRYRARLTMNRACDLLYRGHLSIKEIAAELGFCDEFHFSRRFRQIVGVPPSRYALPGSGSVGEPRRLTTA